MQTYLIEDVIKMLRKNPDKKFTYDSAQEGSYITMEGDKVVWRGVLQNGQEFVLRMNDTLWYEFHQKPMTFKEICELVEEKGIEIKVKVVHEGALYCDWMYFDDLLIELANELPTPIVDEVLLHGKWYWRLVN